MLEELEKAKPEGMATADPQAETLEQHKTVDSTRPGQPAREFGGPKGPEPTRFGDWERAGRCIDF